MSKAAMAFDEPEFVEIATTQSTEPASPESSHDSQEAPLDVHDDVDSEVPTVPLENSYSSCFPASPDRSRSRSPRKPVETLCAPPTWSAGGFSPCDDTQMSDDTQMIEAHDSGHNKNEGQETTGCIPPASSLAGGGSPGDDKQDRGETVTIGVGIRCCCAFHAHRPHRTHGKE